MSREELFQKFGVPRKEWSFKGGDFNVQVVHHYRDVSATQATFMAHGLSQDDTGQRWNVYAFIFPVHRLFADFDALSDSFGQPVCQAMPFHLGPSFLRRHFNEKGEVICIQVGSDYNHLGDDRFECAETPEDAWRVFADADQLIEYLKTTTVPGVPK